VATLFEERELKLYAEPMSAADLELAATCFTVQFLDGDMSIPEMEAVVFVGRNLDAGDERTVYFQDAGSYRGVIRFESAAAEDGAVFYAQSEDEINHIFEFERALDILMNCSLRRRHKTPTA
jgi:hypothetical protein